MAPVCRKNRNTVYSNMYYVLEWLNYVDGREASGQDTKKSEKYMKQMQAYWDGSWVIYRKDRELFLGNPATHEANNVFESDVIINVDVFSDIVTLWDVKNEELDHSNTVILP